MKAKSVFYEIKSKTSGKSYYGSTVNFRKRVADHRRLLFRNSHHSSHLQNAWNLYGEVDFDFRVLVVCETRDFAAFLEKRALDKWHKNSYNVSTEVNQAHQLGRPCSIERRIKISLKNRGKTVSEETKHKIRLARLQQISSGMLGRTHTTETKQRIKDARSKQTPPMRGKQTSLEARRKQSAAKIGNRCRSMVVRTLDACFFGLDYAALHYGISTVTARKYARNNLNGWVYANKPKG